MLLELLSAQSVSIFDVMIFVTLFLFLIELNRNDDLGLPGYVIFSLTFLMFFFSVRLGGIFLIVLHVMLSIFFLAISPMLLGGIYWTVKGHLAKKESEILRRKYRNR